MVNWRIGLHVAIAVAALPVLFGLAAFIARSAGEPTPRWAELGQMNGFPDAGPVALWLLAVFVNGWGEEVGWRGFAIESLRERHGLLGASLRFAPIWALWHLPLFLLLEGYRGFDAVTGVGFLIGLACGSIVLAWVYERAGKSLFAAALFHGTYNMFSGTAAARGLPAAVVTTGIMLAAVVIAISELRRRAPAA
jgi:membrane protease YdiL (CAAX protease family)